MIFNKKRDNRYKCEKLLLICEEYYHATGTLDWNLFFTSERYVRNMIRGVLNARVEDGRLSKDSYLEDLVEEHVCDPKYFKNFLKLQSKSSNKFYAVNLYDDYFLETIR